MNNIKNLTRYKKLKSWLSLSFSLFIFLNVMTVNASAACTDPNKYAADCDLDGDGIINSVDLDDDNDGILDTDEYNGTLTISNGDFSKNGADWNNTGFQFVDGKYAYINVDQTAILSLSNTSSCAHPSISSLSFDYGWNNGTNGGQTKDTSAALELQIDGVRYLYIKTPSDGGANQDNATDQKGDALVTAYNGATFTISNPSTNGPQYIDHSLHLKWKFTTITVHLPQADANATGVIKFSGRTNADDFAIDNVRYPTNSSNNACLLDTDNDGIPDNQDLDSDNDGCPDSREGNGDFTVSPLPLPVNKTTSSRSYGVPTVAGAGQSIGESRNANDATACDAPSLSLIKTSNANGKVNVGQVITYMITARNNGNVTIHNVNVNDRKISPNSKVCASLAQNATCTLTGTYTVTQADIDTGSILNTATAKANETNNHNTSLTVYTTGTPNLSLSKISNTNTIKNVGQVITYTITAQNHGSKTLHSVKVNDTKTTPSSKECTSLAPKETCVLTGTSQSFFFPGWAALHDTSFS